jgi:endonuclease-3 related protein
MTLSRRRELLHEIHGRLLRMLGSQHWWPADTPFEVIVGAILTQNIAWKNVTQALERLREKGILDFDSLRALDEASLASLIRGAGWYNQKAKKLKAFCAYVSERFDGNLDRFLALDMEALRSELLAIRGIGPETADSIILYAAHQPSFVVDAYTHRIFMRHGWIPETIAYEELRDYFMDALESDALLFGEFHGLLVRVGHLYCRRGKPLCGECPMNVWLDGADENRGI